MKRLALALSALLGLLALVSVLIWADNSGIDVAGGRVALSPVVVYTTTVDIPTYPYAACLRPPQTGAAGVPFQRLDWTCLASAGPPVTQSYTLLVLANDYLTVTLLPELGGRVYEMVFKPTGHNELYRNPVLKPAPWGPPEQGWWLAAGGLEWGFPVEEHGYEWGVPWAYQVVSGTAGVTVTVRDSDAVTRATLSVALHLPADRAALVVRPQISNPTPAAVDVKYWTNAMLVPGPQNAPSADLRFLFQGEQVTVHSTGDLDLPQSGELMDWPVHGGRDYSRLGEWDQWLGFFEAPQAHGPFAGVYDTSADEGVLRVYPPDLALGSKGFGFGWSDPLPSSDWTDDGSSYVEVHGGLAPTFDDAVSLSPGQVVSWTEVWYPVAGLGGVSAASADAALRLVRVEERLALGLFTPAAHENVDLWLWRDDCTPVGHWRYPRVDPARPVAFELAAGGLAPEALHLVALDDDSVLGGVNPIDCLPPAAAVMPLPTSVTTTTFVVRWQGDDVWSGVSSYDLQVRAGYGAAWTDWLTHTSATSATFDGLDGQTYFFRARARDASGNVGVYGDAEWGQGFTSVLVTPAPVLVTSRKAVEPALPVPGLRVSYTLRLSNTGSLLAAGVRLTDVLPPSLALVSGTLHADSGSPPVAAGGVITWRGALSPGQEVRIGYAAAPGTALLLGVPLTNTFWLAANGIAPLQRQAVVVYWQRAFLPIIQRGF